MHCLRGVLLRSTLETHAPHPQQVRYLLLVYCFGTGPVAAETRTHQPFVVRFYSARPIRVRVHEAAQLPALGTPALHTALLTLQGSPGVRLRRHVQALNASVSLVTVRGDGVVALLVCNEGTEDVEVQVRADCKVMTARARAGLLPHEPVPEPPQQQPNAGRRWPIKTKRYSATVAARAGTQCLAMTLAQSGMFWEFLGVDVRVGPAPATACNAPGQSPAQSPTRKQGTLRVWLAPTAEKAAPRALGLFEPLDVQRGLLEACRAESRAQRQTSPRRDTSAEVLEDALMQSLQMAQEEEDLRCALAHSLDEMPSALHGMKAVLLGRLLPASFLLRLCRPPSLPPSLPPTLCPSVRPSLSPTAAEVLLYDNCSGAAAAASAARQLWQLR